MGNGAILMAMDNRTRLIGAIRSTPYVLAILCSILSLYEGLPEALSPFEGTYYYERILYYFMFFLLICSVFAKGVVRSVLVLISCASIFSTDLAGLFRRLRHVPIRPPDGGPIYMEVWIQIALVGLFFVVLVIEAAMLIRSRADQP